MAMRYTGKHRWLGLGLAGILTLGCSDEPAEPPPVATDEIKYAEQSEALRGMQWIRVNPSFEAVQDVSLGAATGLVGEVEQRSLFQPGSL